MTFLEYQKLAIRTLPPATEPGGRLETLALGFTGEPAEYMCAKGRKGRIKEMGDCFWYLASIMYRYNNFKGIKPVLRIKSRLPWTTNLLIATGLAGDIIKKHTGHLHAINVQRLADYVHTAKVCMERICKAEGIDLAEVWNGNIAKLRKRYPDGFTVEASINRVE